MGYDFTGGRIFDFPIDFSMGLKAMTHDQQKLANRLGQQIIANGFEITLANFFKNSGMNDTIITRCLTILWFFLMILSNTTSVSSDVISTVHNNWLLSPLKTLFYYYAEVAKSSEWKESFSNVHG